MGGTHENQGYKSNDNQSNMFSFNGGKSMMSKRWNDIESTLKGKKFGGLTGKKDQSRKYG